MRTLKKYKLVYIEWLDAESDHKWTDKKEAIAWSNNRCIISETGWVISTGKDYLLLSSELAKDGEIGNRTKIPKKCIITIRRISYEAPRRNRNERRRSKAVSRATSL